MSHLRLAACLLAVSPIGLTAQADPPGRFLGASAYDQARHRLVLFGGVGSEDGVMNDTWEWDGNVWKQLTPDVSPPARAGHSMAFDPVRRVTLLFGGAGDQPLNDFWVFNGSTWRELTVEERPGPRLAALMYWNPDRQSIQLLGGQTITHRLNDLWEWNGSKWTQLRASTEPASPWMQETTMVFTEVPNSAIEAMLKSDLRNYITAQEAFYADNNRYAKTLEELKSGTGYQASSSVSVDMLQVTAETHAATASHYESPAGRCFIYVGDRPGSFPSEMKEGAPLCVGFE